MQIQLSGISLTVPPGWRTNRPTASDHLLRATCARGGDRASPPRFDVYAGAPSPVGMAALLEQRAPGAVLDDEDSFTSAAGPVQYARASAVDDGVDLVHDLWCWEFEDVAFVLLATSTGGDYPEFFDLFELVAETCAPDPELASVG